MSKPDCHSKIVGDWLAIYTLENQDGYPVVSELRVLACPHEWRDREWRDRRTPDGEFTPPIGPEIRDVLDGTIKPGPPPRGGITNRLLRELSPSAMPAQRQEILSRLPEHLARDRHYNPRGKPRRPGAPGHGTRYYAEFALEYVQTCERPSRRPVADIAEAHPHLTYEYVRDVIHDARERGLLTRAPPGKPGGQLTQKAIDALQGASPQVNR